MTLDEITGDSPYGGHYDRRRRRLGGDEGLMDETAPYRGISSATRFRMR